MPAYLACQEGRDSLEVSTGMLVQMVNGAGQQAR